MQEINLQREALGQSVLSLSARFASVIDFPMYTFSCIWHISIQIYETFLPQKFLAPSEGFKLVSPKHHLSIHCPKFLGNVRV